MNHVTIFYILHGRFHNIFYSLVIELLHALDLLGLNENLFLLQSEQYRKIFVKCIYIR